MSDHDFYTEEEVTFKIQETQPDETNVNNEVVQETTANEEHFYDTNENKHDEETASFMTGVENEESKTHDEETGSFIATGNMITSVAMPEVISIESKDENNKYFDWKPKCITDYSCCCTTQNKLITGAVTLCLTGYILYRVMRR